MITNTTTKRPDSITQAWWTTIAGQCERFFDLSKAFRIGDDPETLAQILAEMNAIYTAINTADSPLQIGKTCENLCSAMESLIDSLTELSLNHQTDSMRSLHRALYDLQRFHISLDELNLRYKPRRIRN